MSEPVTLTEHDLTRIERQALDFIEAHLGPSFAASIIEKVPDLIRELRGVRSDYAELDKLFDRLHAADLRGMLLWREQSLTEREMLQPDRACMVQWLLDERDRLLAMLPEGSR